MYPSWSDSGASLFLHSELGPHDQANLVHLDKYEELVWVGTQRGRLLSFLVDFNSAPPYQGYSRFVSHSSEERVVQILSRPEGVVSLTRSGLSLHSRGGVSGELISKKAVRRMAAGGFSAIDSFPHHQVHVAIGTSGAKTLFYADTMKGELSTFFDLPHSVSTIHCSDSLIAIGGTTGQISFVEGRSSRIASTVAAHPCEVSSIASNGNYFFSTGKREGWTRGGGQYSGPQSLVPDVFLKVFDLRFLGRHSIPVSVPSGAMQVSTWGEAVLILSPGGAWQQADLFPGSAQLRNSEYFQTECFAPASPDLPTGIVDWSVSSCATTLLDTAGAVHLWMHRDSALKLNPDSLGNLLLPISRSPVMPSFSEILSPTTKDALFDHLPTRVYSDSVRDGTWLCWAETSSEWDGMLEVPTPLRAPVPVLPDILAAKKEWDKSISYCANTSGFGVNSLVARATSAGYRKTPPLSPQKPYHALKDLEGIDLSLNEAGRWKFTPVDHSVNHSLFPFNLYNKSSQCGLENGQTLDVLNPLVQVLYVANASVKSMIKSHACRREFCVACELGFLFHMMDQARFARHKVCHPTRLGRCVKKIIFGDKYFACEFAELWDLVVAQLDRELDGKFKHHVAPVGGTSPAQLVPVDVSILKSKKLPDSIFVHPDDPHPSSYSLTSVVVKVASPGVTPRGKAGAHYVVVSAVVDDLNTDGAARSRANSMRSSPDKEEIRPLPPWYLFNDFIVTRSSAQEASDCGGSWREPVVAFYVDPHTPEQLRYPGENHVSLETFRWDENLARSRDDHRPTFCPLSDVELEQLPCVVALDTEFISVGLGNVEIREDGSREVGRPGDMAVGRVSVIRCAPGTPLDGVPIIDHYVAMDESDIKDYVTRFSGIVPGDLDVNVSRHWLTSSKSLYQKLRFLVDAGCTFIGHGLHTDFRILNLHVPASCVIDTVELFHIPGQRFLSLKFLAGKLLKKSIQDKDMHCSIEDAKTAMELYRVYLERKAANQLEATIKELYEIGRTRGWK